MPPLPQHPILQKSFAIIDREMGAHDLPLEEYAILRRIIHSTADFEFRHWLRIGPGAIPVAIAALQRGVPIITDVGMVRQGCQSMVRRTFGNRLVAAVDLAETAELGRTRTETGILRAWEQFPGGIFVIGNAPTALQALCDLIQAKPTVSVPTPTPTVPTPTPTSIPAPALIPALIIGAPVGFVGVEAAKATLAATPVAQIRVEGRKGGSPVAAAIVNALLVLAWEGQP
ncbi:precorrin-8X methylmutase [Leptolyngbya sp. PCC 6406]|uniref:precorrin-8X methylmutase n=1 Tax=Leptolyngbya sp. PCC 6406 TaxID=1173264 RepID=UPI0002AC8C47|nr:precorrin-8X methylmutase [Leptolyngbya sp. PCC 6406]